MEFEPLTRENENEWNEFCLKTDSAWFRHTTYWMKYILDCREDSNSKNLSFFVRQNKKIIAVVPLISQYIYDDKRKDEFANYDTPVPLCAIKNDNIDISRRGVFKEIQNQIEKLRFKTNIKRAKFFIDPLINSDIYNQFDDFNLLPNDFITDIKTTTILDLTIGEENVLREMRKGHKADVKSVFRNGGFRVDTFDKDNPATYETSMGIFQNIHFIDSGRKTRTDASWYDTYNWIKQGNGFLVLIWHEEIQKYVAGAWFMLYKNKAYYGSYATIDTYLLKGKIGYAVQWGAIKYMFEHNVTTYETGWNYYATNFKDKMVDQKVLDISKFKKGFGGKEYPLFTFVKEYYD